MGDTFWEKEYAIWLATVYFGNNWIASSATVLNVPIVLPVETKTLIFLCAFILALCKST